jgi:hypothetical protein
MKITEALELAMKWPGLSCLILLGLIAAFRLVVALLLGIVGSLR